jgi:NAD(P)-dependent dehydrogenase (short-subunit alcohol dehydrogenase family)
VTESAANVPPRGGCAHRGLEGRVAIVTGGNTGIGSAISERLAAEGAHVGIAAVEDLRGAESLADRLSNETVGAIAVRCDVTDATSIADAIDSVTGELGPPTVLVNNAAVLSRTPFDELEHDAWHAAIDVALSGTFRCAQAIVPVMRKAGDGAIVNLASELVWLGGRNLAHYVSAKAGVVGLTRALASELAPAIRVNAVAPGPTDTRMLAPSAREPSSIRAIPLRRLGTPYDVAAAVAFLASDDAAWITGQVLGVNGGLVMA